MKTKNSAFTLVELLVVITIIALLAGLAFPAFTKALERVHATKDLSNLRQIGIGMIAYLYDNNDTMFSKLDWPAGSSSSSASGGSGGGGSNDPGLYSNYVSNIKIFQSPFDRRNPGTTIATANVSYGINTNLLNPVAPFNGNMNNVYAPSSTILMAPAYKAGSDPNQASTWQGTASQATPLTVGNGGSTNQFWGIYSGKTMTNVLFCDGHVAGMKWNDFVNPGTDPTNPDAYYRWTPAYNNPNGN